MRPRWSIGWHWIFLVATVLGFFSSFQAHRLMALQSGVSMFRPKLVFLNLTYWYAPALLTPLTVWFAQRFRFGSSTWTRSVMVHLGGLAVFALASAVILIATHAMLYPDVLKMDPSGKAWTWWSFSQRQFLTNLDWSMMTYCAIVGLTNGVDYYHEARERAVRSAQLETKLVQAQLKTLQGQLHPHFLFNTLHAISALLHKDKEDADRMISRLSDLLRLTLDLGGTQEVSLKRELEFLEKYLEIEQIRFRDRLTVKFAVDSEVLDARVPTLILQPLVENAIKHGIATQTGGGLVEIAAGRENGWLSMLVRDSGEGLSDSALASLEKGIGLSNTRARLECLYGSSHRFEFSNVSGGLAVKIVVPLRTDTLAATTGPRAASRVA